MADPDGNLPGDWFEDPFWAATAWSAEQLSRANLIDSILGWPMSQRLSWSGLPSIELAHGTAAHYRESLSQRTPEARLTELLDEAQVGVLIGSHIHKPMVRPLEGGRLVLNTGAVGAPFNDDPRAQYLLLDADGGRWQPTIRAVPYDRSGVLERFESSGLLREGGVSAEISGRKSGWPAACIPPTGCGPKTAASRAPRKPGVNFKPSFRSASCRASGQSGR